MARGRRGGRMKSFCLLAAAALLASCGGSGSSSSDSGSSASLASNGPKPPSQFGLCMSCHSSEKGAPNRIGPNLAGVIGRKAGTAPGFAYSDAMKGSGIVWNEDQIARFIVNPSAMVPGTKMMIHGPRDPAAQKAITSYLAQISQ
ncbi:MAG: c-type cytochrome [Alphaproteobacteria bacterium]|nr:MAG: c-type cytochrome [Alphaproteobacteria bacterium]